MLSLLIYCGQVNWFKVRFGFGLYAELSHKTVPRSDVSLLVLPGRLISWQTHDSKPSRLRCNVLLVWGIWQRPEFQEDSAFEKLVHRIEKTDTHLQPILEGGGLRDGYELHLVANIQVNESATGIPPLNLHVFAPWIDLESFFSGASKLAQPKYVCLATQLAGLLTICKRGDTFSYS